MTPYLLNNLIRPNIKKTNVKVTNDLRSNLYNLYQQNKILNGPRVNIGGDHSMSIATVADSIKRYKDLKVVWMDAHCDINTYEMSTTKNYHGMPLSILTGLEGDRSLNFTNKKIKFKNILYIGVRDIDPYEREIVKKHKIKYITVDEIRSNLDKALSDIKNFISESPVHFSFDVDVLDPTVMPSTGTPVENGLELEPCKIIIDEMLTNNLVSVDLTELNLSLGDREKSLNNVIHLFKNYIF